MKPLIIAAMALFATSASAEVFTLTNLDYPARADWWRPWEYRGNGSLVQTADTWRLTGADLLAVRVPNIAFALATAEADESLTFDWSFTTWDNLDVDCDPGGFVLNGVLTQLTWDQSTVGAAHRNSWEAGSLTFDLQAGDIFGFYVASGDSSHGAGVLDFTQRAAAPAAITPVPEPQTWMMLVAGFGALGAMIRRHGCVRTITFPSR